MPPSLPSGRQAKFQRVHVPQGVPSVPSAEIWHCLRTGPPIVNLLATIMSPCSSVHAGLALPFGHHPHSQFHPRRHIQRSQSLWWSILPHESKSNVWRVHTLLIPIHFPTFTTLLIPIFCPTLMTLIRRLTFATSIPYTIRYLLQSYNLAICIPL